MTPRAEFDDRQNAEWRILGPMLDAALLAAHEVRKHPGHKARERALAEESRMVDSMADKPYVHILHRSTDTETIPTDAAIAAEVRAELEPLLAQVCVILNKARAHGLMTGFNCGLDQYGRHSPSRIDVTRPL